MKLFRSLAGAILLMGFFWGGALAESFDIFNYTPPQGWKKSNLQGGVMLSLQTRESFGSIVLYASVPAGNNPQQNFQGEWKRLVEEGLGLSGEPTTEMGPPNGDYQNLAGGIAVSQDGLDYVVLLSTFTGNGRVASILYITTDEKLFDLFDRFNSSLKLSKPRAAQAPPVNVARPPANVAANARTIATPTTRFNDGWVSTIENGFVRVARGEVVVLLHYGMPLPENMWVMGNEQERVNHYWNRLVAPRYRVDELKVFKNGTCYFCLYFGEGSATEIATGARKHVALYIGFDKGLGYAIQVVAPSFAAFQREFPNIEAVGKMTGYNKFAVKAADLIGKWQESSSVAGQYYNSITGAYAGMNAVSSVHSFTFNRDGTYASTHAGASGFVGSQQFYSQKYQGRLTPNDWRMNLTHRFNNQTEVFEAYFEMTGAGPVLHLIRVNAPGIHYRLMRE
ncbi:hypothetical protein [uncultured Meiothermus sp.]|uniref:hypothetical protein n=1 Tax=uncultured Meiothermus sp. TaxID=157471 RepID=UPI00260FD9E2|nr:hypothetical protein [uncultured Meiothermus sp.]